MLSIPGPLDKQDSCSARASLRLPAAVSRELLPAATRRENQELKPDAPSGHGLAAALGIQTSTIAMPQYLRNDAVRLFEASMETLQLAIMGLGPPYPHGLR